jgi:hypothetical protein
MAGIYYDDLLSILSNAGIPFGLNHITDGWERRSRSSGGFPAPPLGVQFHHTASSASVESDLNYMVHGSPDRPVGNVLIDRTGIWWPIAAGAANTSGKGGPSSFSRGVVPLDKGNTTLWSLECANNGVGEPWPQVQIDSAIAGSNALNAHFGNLPTDVITHAAYTSRKIDPATAAAVQGPWRPASVNSSGTWDVWDLTNECSRRAGTLPPPTIGKVVDMYVIAVSRNGWPGPVDLVVDSANTRWNRDGNTSSLDKIAGVPRIEVDKNQTLGLLRDRPGSGECPFEILPDYFDAELAAAW